MQPLPFVIVTAVLLHTTRGYKTSLNQSIFSRIQLFWSRTRGSGWWHANLCPLFSKTGHESHTRLPEHISILYMGWLHLGALNLYLFPSGAAASGWRLEAWLCNLPRLCPLSLSLCPLGVAPAGVLGSFGRGSLPESQSVCTLGRGELGPPPSHRQPRLSGCHLSQLFPQRRCRCCSPLHKMWEHTPICAQAARQLWCLVLIE